MIKGVPETVENEVKSQKQELLGMLVATLGTNLLGNMLARKGVLTAGEGTIRGGQNVWCHLIL